MAENDTIPCKILILGEARVGKTSILNRFISGTFSPTHTPTLAANFVTKTIYLKEYNKSIRFDIWEFCGESKYRALIKVFYKNPNFCILVYDSNDESSFIELQNYWIEDVKTEAPNSSNSINFII